MRVVRRYEGLRRAAKTLGFTIEKIDAIPDGKNMYHECLQVHEASARFTERATGDATYDELVALHGQAIKELNDILIRAKDGRFEDSYRGADFGAQGAST